MFDQKYDLISRQNYLADNQLTQDQIAHPVETQYLEQIHTENPLLPAKNS